MSKAGIQSNRGDGYQTLVAFDWALTVLSDPAYQWLEIDSVTWTVDDVVIGKADGTKICCQCKKNQTAFKSWSIADLTDELDKAISLLAKDQSALVRFYSRDSFGSLSALKEYSISYAEESAYRANLGVAHKKTDSELNNLIAKSSIKLSTYDFLCRTSFCVTEDLDRLQTLLHERLRQMVSNPPAAYNSLWRQLDFLGMRINDSDRSLTTLYRLTKEDLNNRVTEAGSMLIPPMDMVQVRPTFQSTSAIGRTWRTDIGGRHFSTPLVNELLKAIEGKHRSILLSGMPGAGKTCVMLALQDELEKIAKNRSGLLPLFIQSREFADFVTAQDREAQGLSAQWVERVARFAEDGHVVVLIDSLDVLSIAREHSVLRYFLAQIDRLLLVPNVTIVTACRDFDRHYDRRIAQRTWDKEFICKPLDWEIEVAPLLVQLGIDVSTVDTTTRELIRNPRELALYVDLAQIGGSFNVVTSHALAQRYLDMIIQADSALGDTAMQAIEATATEMLKLRCLAVPQQRFPASREIQRGLLSNKVLHETQDGQITFGHQTLLDVLVISAAVRRGVTLNEFIHGLPPVPFVRPTIRSFVAHLASGNRREFRKQLRSVLTGNHAFHIRRLVAESLSEQIPLDEDWPLIRDIRSHFPEIFQVVYARATRVEWHYFWFKHLIPVLKDTRNAEGLTTHVHWVSQWKKDDAGGILAFWGEVLALDWIDKRQIARQLEIALSDFHKEHSAMLAPLLMALLDLPREPHSSIGRALAQCIDGGGMDDAALWRYIASEVRDEDVVNYRFDNKLHCQPHEFGNSGDEFLADRMRQSDTLLDLAIADIERWSRIKTLRYGETLLSYWSGFLRETSYADAHDRTDHRHVDSERTLLDAIEAGIVQRANSQSEWWQINRRRLCFSTEGALRYFALLACTSSPSVNLDVIGQMLCDKAFLESDLSYELGTLMQTAFLQLDATTQDAIQATVLTVGQESTIDPRESGWILQRQAQLIVTIPRHLRCPDAQTVVDGAERITWPLIRQPSIGMHGGMVSAPFSFEVFLNSSDGAVLKLLAHYNGHERNSFDDFLTGGEREVGSQLEEASSRHPARFMNLLSTNWDQIADRFRDDIMYGVATYLAHRYGNLQTNGAWRPIEAADPDALARQILQELERHLTHWRHRRAASKALQGCAPVLKGVQDAERLTLLAMDFSTSEEESHISGDSVSLLTIGINMARGNAADSLMILANQLEENGRAWPESLPSALRLFSMDENPAVRAVLLRRMPYLQLHHTELGWSLFELAMQDASDGLWALAESCLYHAYHKRYDIVGPWLQRLYREGSGRDLATWGRICALSALSKKLPKQTLLVDLKTLNSEEAWRGAASVWTNPSNVRQHWDKCFAGLEVGLSSENLHAAAVARKVRNLFQEASPPVHIPIEILQRSFTLLEAETESARSAIFGFYAWLNATSILDPMYALDATEIYVEFIRGTRSYVYDHENNLTQLLTRLFAEAEEREESDGKAMLKRVVVVQDDFLALGVNGVSEWLRVAERP